MRIIFIISGLFYFKAADNGADADAKLDAGINPMATTATIEYSAEEMIRSKEQQDRCNICQGIIQ